MISRTTFAALTSSERQLLRAQFARSGQCARCFHSARRREAEVQRPEDGSPSIKDSTTRAENNDPQTQQPLSTKRARAQRISDELTAINRGPPPGNPNSGPGSALGTNQLNDRPRPSVSAGFTETPQSVGAGGQRMGENVPAGREGVNAQGVGRLAGTDERVRNEHPRPQGTRTADEMQEPADGGASVFEASTPEQAGQAMDTITDQDSVLDRGQEARLRGRLADARPQGIPFRPRRSDANELLLQGRGASVPTTEHPVATVLDRYKLVTDPSRNPSQPSGREQRTLYKGSVLGITDKLIAGRYDLQRMLSGQVYQRSILNELAKKTMLNDTYLEHDGERLIKKVQSLLPAAQPSPTAAAQKQELAPAKATARTS